jgi:hypothetical protein
MDAVLLSGGVPKPDEPLYPYTKGKPKALINIGGIPMIQWVLDAIEAAKTVSKVVVVGMSPENNLTSTKISAYIPSKGDLLENVRLGVVELTEQNPESGHALIVSSDIPAVTAESIDWVVNKSSESDKDLYYSIITRQIMEARFPDSNRSYTRLRDVEVCGGDMNVVRMLKVAGDDELYRNIMDARKNVFKQASLIGYDTLFYLLIRRFDLKSAVKQVEKRLNITGEAVLCPYAEVGMDVDKPHQLEILRADLDKKTVV